MSHSFDHSPATWLWNCCSRWLVQRIWMIEPIAPLPKCQSGIHCYLACWRIAASGRKSPHQSTGAKPSHPTSASFRTECKLQTLFAFSQNASARHSEFVSAKAIKPNGDVCWADDLRQSPWTRTIALRAWNWGHARHRPEWKCCVSKVQKSKRERPQMVARLYSKCFHLCKSYAQMTRGLT